MMETLKGKHGEDYRCEKVQRGGLTKCDTCEVASEVLSNHLQLAVVIAIEQKNAQE
jgi:hypothetical protein